MDETVHDTLRMRSDDITALLQDNKEHDSDGSSKRTSKRWSMQQQKAVVTVMEEGGVRRNVSIVPRNLSGQGIGFFHGGYMHIGTPCVVTLRTTKGYPRSHKGKIVRCIHKKGRLHEVGVTFDEEISPREYFIDAGDAPLFNSEAVEVERLSGSAMVVVGSNAEQSLIGEYFKSSGMTLTHANTGGEALGSLAEADPDMIFADSALEDMGWKDFVEKLRENGFVGPIVLLSAVKDQSVRISALTAGASEVIFKPLNASIFHRAAAEYLVTSKGSTNALQPMICELDTGAIDREVITQYIDELQDHAVTLHHAVKGDDIDTIRRVVQSIGATAHGFGFPSLGESAEEAIKVLDNPSGAQMLKLRAYEIMKMCRRAEAPVEENPATDGDAQPEAEAA
ncbi:MAG: response regulator [Planctomycetota bacterium]